MTQKIRSTCLMLAILRITMVLTACSVSWGLRQVVDPDHQAGLLIYFKKETREEDVMQFWDSVLSTPDPRGGHQLLPGISGVMGNQSVQGHQSLRVDFWPSTTQEQRAYVKSQVLTSPLVYKILENRKPRSVTQLHDQ